MDNNLLHLNFLPDELIYIIIEQLINLVKISQNNKLDIPLINLSERYKLIYNEYIKNIQEGWIFNFVLYDIETTLNMVCTYTEDKKYNSHSTTSKYHGQELSCVFSFREKFSDAKYIIYYDLFGQDKLKNSITICVYAVEINGRLVYKLFRDDMKTSPVTTVYESNNWKNIWDKLSLEDQNAILYQNGFPTKE